MVEITSKNDGYKGKYDKNGENIESHLPKVNVLRYPFFTPIILDAEKNEINGM